MKLEITPEVKEKIYDKHSERPPITGYEVGLCEGIEFALSVIKVGYDFLSETSFVDEDVSTAEITAEIKRELHEKYNDQHTSGYRKEGINEGIEFVLKAVGVNSGFLSEINLSRRRNMEKAKLTREQDYALKQLLESTVYAEDLGLLVARQADQISRQVGWAGFYDALDSLSIDDLCRALYVGYEIIEEDQTVVIDEHMRELLRASRREFDVDQYISNEDAETFKQGFDAGMKTLGIKL